MCDGDITITIIKFKKIIFNSVFIINSNIKRNLYVQNVSVYYLFNAEYEQI